MILPKRKGAEQGHGYFRIALAKFLSGQYRFTVNPEEVLCMAQDPLAIAAKALDIFHELNYIRNRIHWFQRQGLAVQIADFDIRQKPFLL